MQEEQLIRYQQGNAELQQQLEFSVREKQTVKDELKKGKRNATNNTGIR